MVVKARREDASQTKIPQEERADVRRESRWECTLNCFTNIQLYWCKVVRYICIQVYRYTGIQVYRYTGIQV